MQGIGNTNDKRVDYANFKSEATQSSATIEVSTFLELKGQRREQSLLVKAAE
jgi:hypothetical protein